MSMNNNPINQDPIDFIEETAAVRIGARIREIRLVRGLTQLELGEKVGLSADRVRQYETGYRKPKTDMIKAIASALEVQPLALTDPVATSYLGAVYAMFELEKLYDLTLTEADGVFSLQFKSETAQSLVKYLNVWYRALNIYKAELKQAKNTEEAAAVQKRYNCFKWTLPELATDSDATKLQMKILSDALSELRKQLDLDMSSSQDTEENSAS